MYLQSKQNLGSQLKFGSRNVLLSTYFNDFSNRRVPVPVAISGGVFLLEFEKVLKEVVKGQQSMNDDKFRRLLSLIVKSYDRLDSVDMGAILKEYGVKIPAKKGGKDPLTEEESLDLFVTDLKSRIARQLAETGLTGALVQNFFADNTDPYDFKEFGDIGFGTVQQVVNNVQSFYSKFVQRESGDSLATELNAMVTRNPITHATANLLRVFYAGEGSYVVAKESYVIDKLFEEITGAPLVSKEALLEGRFYNVTAVAFPDISYADAVAGFLWSMNTSMGITVDTDGAGSKPIKITSILSELVTGIGAIMPFLPSDAGTPNYVRLEEHYKKVFLMHLIRRITSDVPGDFYGRVTNGIKTNKFFKLDEMQMEFEHSLKAVSIVYESFRDTAFYYRNLFKRDDIMFSDYTTLHHLKRKKITEFVDNLIESMNTTSQSLEHPAYYKLATHVTQHTASDLSMEPFVPEYRFNRKDWSKNRHVTVLDKSNMNAEMEFSAVTAGLSYGSTWFDISDKLIGMGLPVRMVQLADKRKPVFFFTTPVSDNLLGEDALKAMLAAIPVSDIDAISERHEVIGDVIFSMGQRFRPEDIFQFSMRLGLPKEISTKILQLRGGNLKEDWLDISGMNEVTYFVAPEICPIWEIITLDEANRYIPPFIANYPALVTATSESFSLFQREVMVSIPDQVLKNSTKPTTKGSKAKDAKPEAKPDDSVETEDDVEE